MVTGLILHVSTREQKSVPINIISIGLACVLSFRRQGDFNETLMPIDRKSKCKNGTIMQPVASLKTLLKRNILADIWRKCNQDKP
jgi:hypothetical protein